MRKKTIEEYIEIIYLLEKREGRAHTCKISDKLGVKPPSVSEMLKKLDRQNLIRYEMYNGASLTEKGLCIARDLMKKHSIIADFLEIIGVDPLIAEVDACQIEHNINDLTMHQLEKFVLYIKNSQDKQMWIRKFKLGL